ncbi:MAG: FimV/HubP family polar landmark protein [Gammaproteobacteria bacterium]
MRRKWLVWCSMILGLLLITHLAHANSVYYGPTTNQDHFWQIVDKFRPNESISREQMAVAILQANPSAFSDGNVNALRNGQMLRVPTTDEVQQVNALAALKAVQQMNQTWMASHPPQSSPGDGFKTVVRVTSAPRPPSNNNDLPPSFANDNWVSASASDLTNGRSLDSSVLQQQLQDTQQELRQLEQQVNLQVGKLVQQNLLMQAQLANNSEVLEWVLRQMQKNNVSGLRLTPPAVLSNKSLQIMGQPLPKMNSNSTKLVLGIIIVVLLVLLGIWLPQAQKSRDNLQAEQLINKSRTRGAATDPIKPVEPDVLKANSQEPVMQETSEYDFLGGQEGMIAKLNIARVYLDMEDFATAGKYLEEVMTHGTEEQRREAGRLQQKIQAAMTGLSH